MTYANSTDMPNEYYQAKAKMEMGRWSEARALLMKAYTKLPAVRDLAAVHPLEIMLGDCYLEEGFYHLAKKHYQSARSRLQRMSSPPPEMLAEALSRLGTYCISIQDYTSAVSFLDSALELRLAIFGADHIETSHCYDNLGRTYWNLGDFIKARQYFQRAYRIRKEAESEKLMAESLNNIGLSFQDAGLLTEAKIYFDSALTIYHTLSNAPPLRKADVLLNLGTVHSDLAYEKIQHLDTARQFLTAAMASVTPESNQEKLFMATALNNLANIYVLQKRDRNALSLFRKSLALKESVLGTSHPENAETLYNMALTEYGAKNFQSARAYLTRASHALDYDPSDENRFQRISDFWILLNIQYFQMVVALELYQANKQTTALDSAFAQFSETDEIINQLYVRYDGLGSKQSLISISHFIYERALEMAFLLYKATAEQKYWHHAFFYSEKSRGLLLLEALQKSKAQEFAGIPDPLLDRIRQVEEDITHLETRQFLTRQTEIRDSISNDLFALHRQLDDLITQIADEYPSYFTLRYASDPPTISRLQSDLEEDQSFISFYVSDSRIWVFLINRQSFDAAEISIDSTLLNEDLNQFIHNIRGLPNFGTQQVHKSFQGYADMGYHLYQILLGPHADKIKNKITIIPDGPLAFLPFEALLTKPTNTPSEFDKHAYLIRDKSINYNYSARLFLEMNTQNTQRKKGATYLGFAPQFEGRESGSGLTALRHNQAEVLTGSRILPGTTFLGEEATKGNFLLSMADHQIIHLATHGKANDIADEFSFVAFSPKPNEPFEEALLYIREIYGLHTDAEMVILSACETATGRHYTGEGITSIARSFSYAGAKSLIATRWNVNDMTTHDLIGNFLDQIKVGQSKDAAMKQAINQFINTAPKKYTHPFYWSSFIAIGNMGPIEVVEAGVSTNFLIGGILLALLLALLLVKKQIWRPAK